MSIGERVKWDIPRKCPYCTQSSDPFDIHPQPLLRQKIKCTGCNRVWTVDPQLTELGLKEAIAEKLERLIVGR